jgi:ubiquinone/menaquinone biosynthesis C-methylase UbiE
MPLSMIGASEKRSYDVACELFPAVKAHARTILNRVNAIRALPPGSTILDIGAAQGLFVVACAEMGYPCVGVEPWMPARETAYRIAQEHGINLQLLEGTAESLPVPSESFDFVNAMSVLEHVDDLSSALREVYRVLKPGGVFWFFTASSICPRQGEIRGFPGFGWYPDSLKIRIMMWARDHRPDLVAHTTRPAYHWFTPWKARRVLQEAGFRKVFDRWDLRLANEGAIPYQIALTIVRLNAFTKLLADAMVPACSYAAIK